MLGTLSVMPAQLAPLGMACIHRVAREQGYEQNQRGHQIQK